MTQSEAWLVTLLGIGVVFIGLVLCILFINLFGRIARNITWDGAHGHGAAAAAPVPEAEAVPALAPAAADEPIAADVLAVIAATLEIERRLYQGRPGQRLTIAR